MSTLTFILMLDLTLAQAAETPRPDDAVLRWNEVALRTIRVERTPPPVAARNLAILHLAIYDAVNAVAPTHRPFLVSAAPEPDASAEAAAAAAGQRVLAALYPRQREVVDDVFARLVAEVADPAAREHGIDVGRFVADRVLAWRRDDGSENGGRYAPRSGAGLWQPTPTLHRAALLPGWGLVEPFAMRKGTQYCPPAPPTLASAEYARAYNEVKALGGRASALRTAEETQIAYFWADDVGTATPPGHWNRIAQSAARQRGNTLAQNARLFAMLNVSLADAGILCWVLKFTYDFWRPVTAIQGGADDGDPDWLPLLETPPFPAYTSGHSTFSGAAAATLASFFGTDEVRFSTTSEGLPNTSRSFAGFWVAAEEAGQSRIYGGIHWQFDNTEGLRVGRTLGNYVASHHFEPLPASDRPPVITIERMPAELP